jgi:uncharacterized membrane protein YpjA
MNMDILKMDKRIMNILIYHVLVNTDDYLTDDYIEEKSIRYLGVKSTYISKSGNDAIEYFFSTFGYENISSKNNLVEIGKDQYYVSGLHKILSDSFLKHMDNIDKLYTISRKYKLKTILNK